jgi:hypothetical protein
MDTDYKELLARLLAVKEAPKHCIGICGQLGHSFYFKLDRLFERWPDYSGSRDYPVPSARSDLTAAQAYDMADNLWVGQYGDMRKALLDFCIAEVERIIAGEADAL